jgi:hypothetical protein
MHQRREVLPNMAARRSSAVGLPRLVGGDACRAERRGRDPIARSANLSDAPWQPGTELKGWTGAA